MALVGCSGKRGDHKPLQFVKVVTQRGPVAYRDPTGSISPDGRLFAFTDQKKIWVQLIEGGASFEMEKHGTSVRSLTWLPDSKSLVTYERGGEGISWYIYDIDSKKGKPLWTEMQTFKGKNLFSPQQEGGEWEVERSQLRGMVWSADGSQVGAIALNDGKKQLWVFNSQGKEAKIYLETKILESIQWNPLNQSIAGIVEKNGKRAIDLDLLDDNSELLMVDAYGAMAFSPEGKTLYYATTNEKGLLDLWGTEIATGKRTQLSFFSKDTYAPVSTKSGSVLFKLKDYRIFIATASGDGGATNPLTTFQSEIPYWNPNGTKVSFTYGSWRSIKDDAKYPDIAQNLGVVDFEDNKIATQPDYVVRASYSEDQGMSWSPNEKWIAFHSHADGTDDVWLMPADDASKARPITNGGYETGWPRWSPDGKWIVCNTAENSSRINKLVLIGIDQETGELTTPQKDLFPPGLLIANFTDASWTADSKSIVVEYVVDEHHKEIHLVPIDGGPGKKIHAFESDQLYSGISLSFDQKWIAFIAPDKKNTLQVFKVSMDGKEVRQITFDPSHKAHPSFSPTDNRIAFSVFSYDAIFWLL